MEPTVINIRTLVVDDEPLALDLVADYVQQTPFLELVGRCSNAKDAFERIIAGGVDLLLCDIQMPGMSGLTLMKALQSASTLPKVIFTTAFPEYALDGFRLDAVDYLLKPFDDEEFAKSVGKARRLIELEQLAMNVASADNASKETETRNTDNASPDDGFIFVKSEYKLVRIEMSKITYIEGLKDYIRINIDGDVKPVLTLMSLKDAMQKLDEKLFVRLHRSFIVNTKYITGVERSQLLLSDGTRVPVGDKYRTEFANLMNGRVL